MDRRLAAAVVLLVTLTLGAGPDDEAADRGDPFPPADHAGLPSEELLEFLSDWSTEDGEWVDPVLFETTLFLEAERENAP